MKGELMTEQWLPRTPEELFPFFASPANLEAITPPTLGFKVLRSSTPEIGEGTLIDYRLSLHGIPMRWRTRIEAWNPGKSFVDTQLKGPYRKWHHTHTFEAKDGGTLMRDRVLYELPMGWLGRAVAGWLVDAEVKRIFDFRRTALERLFPGRPAR